MLNFSFTFPSNVIFGAGVFQSLGEEVAKFGKTALLVEQAGPLEPVFARGVALMEAAGVKVTELSGVESNPRLSKVEEGIKIVKEQNIEVVVAIGGGSTIDTAKAISVGAGIDITEVQKAISETPGIGAKRLEAIMESLNSKFAKEEDA